MKTYNEIAETILERRDKYVIEQKRKRNMRMKMVSAICLIIVLSMIGIRMKPEQAEPNVSLAAEIEYNLTKLSELDADTLASSNPYDYKDEENYKNIVEMGMAGMIILDEKYQNGELGGLDAYIAAVAMEEIANVDIYAITGKDWASAEEFFGVWRQFISEIPDTLESIVNSDDSPKNKLAQIEKYGIFGDYYLDFLKKNKEKSERKDNFIVYISEDAILTEHDYAMMEEYLHKN